MLQKVEDLTKDAGKILMGFFNKKDLKIFTKEDASPVTEADYAVSDFFIQKLQMFGCPVITEEKVPEQIPDGDYFIIDPLDGTRYFIEGAQHFAILVAFVSRRRPIVGVTYFPALDLLYTAEKGKGAFLNGQKIYNRETRADLVAYSSGFHRRPEAAELIHSMNIKKIKEQESILKMTKMAAGAADFYPRFGKTYEWDTASAQILAEEAGCSVWDVRTAQPLEYSKPRFKNHGFVVFRNDLESKVIDILKTFNEKRV